LVRNNFRQAIALAGVAYKNHLGFGAAHKLHSAKETLTDKHLFSQEIDVTGSLAARFIRVYMTHGESIWRTKQVACFFGRIRKNVLLKYIKRKIVLQLRALFY
jgi:hypothetical protein